jgi:hypothetical protein
MYKNSYRKIYKNYLICSVLELFCFLHRPVCLSLSQELAISLPNTTDNTSLNLPAQSKGIVQITKMATFSFNIVKESTGLLGTFDNIYTITGSSDSLLNILLKSS